MGLEHCLKKHATRIHLWIYPVYMVLVFSGILLLHPEAMSGALSLLVDGDPIFVVCWQGKSSNGLGG